MKKRPSSWKLWTSRVRGYIEPAAIKRSLSRFADDGLVKMGVLPPMMNGAGKVLHISDTPTTIYGYLARVLRRVAPAVVVHTGDLADDIKLEMYPAEADNYAAAVRRLANILLAPHRTVVLALGNHDRADLLPFLPSQCIVCDNDDAINMTFFGARFRMSHYVERVTDKPELYNLFGHEPERESFMDGTDRYFFNGIELMRMIDPVTGEIAALSYPGETKNARALR